MGRNSLGPEGLLFVGVGRRGESMRCIHMLRRVKNYWNIIGGHFVLLLLLTSLITTVVEGADVVTLNCSSTVGGSVIMPGEGDFQYSQDANASIVAMADSGCYFVNWTGTAVDAGKVADVNSASTTVTMDADYTVVANFKPNSIEIIGSWTEGVSHAEEPGYKRALLLFAHAEEAGAISLDSVTYGGQEMTKIIDVNVGTTSRVYVAGYILDEAGITAAVDGNFAFTWSTTPDREGYGSVFLQNVDQTDPIGDSNKNGTLSGNIISTSPLVTYDGDMVFDAATNSNTGFYTVLNGFTEGLQLTITSADAVEGYKPATGVDETPSVYHYNPLRQVLIGFVVQAIVVPFNCDEVQDAYFGLLSDLNGDCYVNYEDLKIITDHWLDNDCTEPENCEGADFEPTDGVVDLFDFSDFAMQWLLCNDPEDPNCIRNWAIVVPSNCGEVQYADFGLLSDLNGDCYVNYEDLKIITDHWLDTDCTMPENCEGADFEPTDGVVDLYDFSDFAVQWLWCNDPEDPNCIPNW